MAKPETPDILVWEGERIARRTLLTRGSLLLAPGVGWLMVLLVLPCLGAVALMFATKGDYGTVEWTFTLTNITRLLGFGILGWSADILRVLSRTLVLAALTTAVSLLMAAPLAFFVASRPTGSRWVWLLFLIVPQSVNLVIRTSGWMMLFAPGSPLTAAAIQLGLVADGMALFPGILAVTAGMVSNALPFAVLPLYSSVERLDTSLIDAAQDLYASPWQTFRHAIWPQIRPGAMVALVLTFVPSMGMFLVSDLLGGAKNLLVGNLVAQQFGTSRDWPFGAAISVTLMSLTMVGVLVLRRYEGREGVPT